MDEKTANPPVEAGEAPPAEVLTEGTAGLVAELSKVAQSLKSTGEKVAEAARINQDLEKERAKAPRVYTDTDKQKDPRTPDDLVNRNPRGDRDLIDLQEASNDALLTATVRAHKGGTLQLNAKGEVRFDRIPKDLYEGIDAYRECRHLMEKTAGKIWETQTATSGTEWVPTGFASTAVGFHTLRTNFPQIFEQVTIPNGVGPFSVPTETTLAYAVIEDELTNPSASFVPTGIFKSALTGVAAFTPKKHANGHVVTMEGVEDIVVDSIRRAQENSANTLRDGLRQAIINGQTASDGTLDVAPATSGLFAADGYSNAGGDNGLRLHCVVNSFTTAIGGTLTAVNILAARSSMGNFGALPEEVATVMGAQSYMGLLQDTNVLTVDKFGAGATILAGQVASVAGVPVFTDSQFLDTMDTGGVNAGTSTKGGAIVVNRKRWLLATARNANTILLPQPGMDLMNVISRMRTHFVVAVQDEHSAHYIINLT